MNDEISHLMLNLLDEAYQILEDLEGRLTTGGFERLLT